MLRHTQIIVKFLAIFLLKSAFKVNLGIIIAIYKFTLFDKG